MQQQSNSNATEMQQQCSTAMPSSMPTATAMPANKKARKAIKNAKTIQAKSLWIGKEHTLDILGKCN
jgi:hypothetical protein